MTTIESQNDSPIAKLYRGLSKLPLGHALFAKAICMKAPYFQSIKPELITLEKGCAIWKIRKRRAVTNHIGTIHAIAMCNLAELVGGTALDYTLPSHLRWIPKGMQVSYLKKAETDLTGSCEIHEAQFSAGDFPLTVLVKNAQEEVVFKAVINMWISEK